MFRKPKPEPSFFKVICSDDFTRLLRLPPIIGQKYGERLPGKVQLRTGSGKTWNVKLERTGDEERRYCFTEGWNRFVEDARLQFGEFLMFCFRGNSIFDVTVFGVNECEKQISGCNLIVKEEPDPHDDDEFSKGCIPSKNRKYSPGVINKRRSKALKTAVGSKADKSYEEERSFYFKISLKPHHLARLSPPRKFMVAAGLTERKTVMLEYVAEGDVKEVVLDHRPQNYRTDFTVGWPKFSRANLVIGRTYSFEFKPSMDVIQVKNLDTEN